MQYFTILPYSFSRSMESAFFYLRATFDQVNAEVNTVVTTVIRNSLEWYNMFINIILINTELAYPSHDKVQQFEHREYPSDQYSIQVVVLATPAPNGLQDD